MTLQLVHRFNQVRRFFEACRSRRADIALIGDSNMQSSSVGMSLALPYAWGRRFGWYATGVHATNATGNYTLDYRASFGSGSTFDAVPATHTAYAWSQAPDPIYKAGAFGEPFGNIFLSLAANHPMAARALKWRFRYGTFATGSGVIKPVCRYDSSFSYLGTGSVTTSTGTNGMAEGSLSIAAGARSADMWFSFQGYLHAHAGAASGPFYSNYQRIEFTDAYAGVAVSTMYAQGGVGTRAPALALQAMTQTQFNEWAAAVVGAQNETRPLLMVQVLEGANDTGFSDPSVGPNPAAGDTPAGVVDNHAAIVNRIRTLWAGAGYDVDDLYFLVGPYHPQEWSRRQWCRDLDDALSAYADGEQNVAVASRSRISTSGYFDARSMYAGSGFPDDAHLTAQGYYDWGDMLVNAAVPAPTAVVRHTSGETLDLKLFDESGQVFDAVNGSFGPWDDAALANYAIAGTELGTSGIYRFELPVNMPRPAAMRGDVTERAGAGAALSDTPVTTLAAADFDGVRQPTLDSLSEDLIDVQRRLIAAEDELAYLDAPVSRAGATAGDTEVDHNTGGVDTLRYVDGGGAGVGGATIRAYVAADYDAGLYVERGRTATRSDGRWLTPLYLDAGVEYAITFAKPGIYQVSRQDVTP